MADTTARTRTLSEFDSKQLLAGFGVPGSPEALAATPEEAADRAEALGWPVAAKLCAEGLAHKTERGLVHLGLRDRESVVRAATDLLARRQPGEEGAQVLVQSMVSGRRELIAGLFRDAQFGPCIMLGLGGILTEALGDVTFRLAPLGRADVDDMIEELQGRRILDEFRGEPAVDRDALAAVLVGLGRLAVERDDVLSVDVNPLIVEGARPVAVDALVEVRS